MSSMAGVWIFSEIAQLWMLQTFIKNNTQGNLENSLLR